MICLNKIENETQPTVKMKTKDGRRLLTQYTSRLKTRFGGLGHSLLANTNIYEASKYYHSPKEKLHTVWKPS